MRWLYRLQARLAITPAESTAVLTLAALFGLGLAAQHLQARLPPVDAAAYALGDSLFAAADTAGAAPEAAPEAAGGPVDLNVADAAALERLPRVGPKTAARILAHRAAHGPFRAVDDLLAVPGIGPKTLAGLAPLVTVGAPGAGQARASSSGGGEGASAGGASRRSRSSSSSVQ